MITVIPDIHGRGFWHEAENLIDSSERVIFLGDYLDPYPYEEITERAAFVNFLHILDFKKSNPDKVILILGNHDGHYFFGDINCSRKSYANEELFRSFFLEDRELFDFAHEETVAGKRFLFTHAGIHPGYLREMRLPEEYSPETVRAMDFSQMLTAYSRCRSWSSRYDYGSPMWCDLEEWARFPEGEYPEGIVQVFGHTQQEYQPVNLYDKCFCLDVRRCFIIDDGGRVCETDRTPLLPISKRDVHKIYK